MTSEIANQFSILGLPVHLMRDYPAWLGDRIQQKLGCHVVTLNAEMTMQAETSPELASIISRAELVIPDGSGIVLYLQMHGRRVQRMPGIELAEALLNRASQQSWSVLFYGGAPGVTDQAAIAWQQRAPGIAIVGTQHGFLKPEDEPAFLAKLQQLQPQLIYIGLGVPRQELWIAKHRHLCPNSIWIGVGGSFDIWAGSKIRAPKWFCDNHLEWVYRLYQEPWRWKRMSALPKFAWRSVVYRLTKRNPVVPS
jgi:N-acetylglucosaminyldiphosphoundecaprenol N-acetyl-beta-D-mannosaminyltransferase